MTGIVERLQAAAGPDRILDATIARESAGLCLHGSWHSEGPDGDRGRVCDDCGADSWGNRGKTGQRLNDPVPLYTASIDAALSLVERKLPTDYHFFELSIGHKRAHCEIHDQRIYDPIGTADAPTAPLALLIALLKALEQKATAP